MSKRIKVTGYIEIEDDEYDDDVHLGPLTSEAFDRYFEAFQMDDLDFKAVD